LAENAEDIPHEALKGNLAGLFRYRFGDYRILYILDKQAKTIEISSVGHRRDVYDE
jgi:mRNA interferase RelE/StbE